MKQIIPLDKSIIPACDVDLGLFEKILQETADIEKVGGYKVGFKLGLLYGLPRIVEVARKYTNKPIIYDHQKAGTDIPDTGKDFADVMVRSGINAVIFFPQSGPVTQNAWIESALEKGLGVIMGGLMTHKGYVQSQGGYIADDQIINMYLNSAKRGISEFVVPGNKPEAITQIRAALQAEGIEPIFYAPGFVTQGGSISEAAKCAGEKWHAIVGRGIYQAEDIRKAAIQHTIQL
ncbi:MAG: orotidine 5'-phosphate decarboxylase / HUMPS family protein [Candidatus Woesearchaeota archaeon]